MHDQPSDEKAQQVQLTGRDESCSKLSSHFALSRRLSPSQENPLERSPSSLRTKITASRGDKRSTKLRVKVKDSGSQTARSERKSQDEKQLVTIADSVMTIRKEETPDLTKNI